jgi:AcrR family transcriptional regulator
MTKTPRDIKEIEKIRELILERAIEIINADGFTGMTMRKIASRMEMSATNIYNYFSNKDEIYINILIRGFKMMYENLQSVYDEHSDSIVRGKKIIQAYLFFGIQNYNYYEIMFSPALPKYNDYVGTPLENLASVEMGYSRKIMDLAMASVSDIMRQNKNSKPAVIEMRMIEVWSMLHGMISLYNSSMIDYLTTKPVNKYESIIDDIVNLVTK